MNIENISNKKVYGVERGTNGQIYICRYKYPCWKIEIQDCSDIRKLAASFKKAAAWLISEEFTPTEKIK